MKHVSARAVLLPAILFAANPLFTGGLAYGQVAPPPEPVEKRFDPPPRVPLFSGPDARLTPKEQKGVAFGRDWAGNRDMPTRGEAGATVCLRGMEIVRPNQVWAMDITYIPMAKGFVYLAVCALCCLIRFSACPRAQ